MKKSITNPGVDFYFSKEKKWRKEFERLRKIILDCGLNEELKWVTLVMHWKKGT